MFLNIFVSIVSFVVCLVPNFGVDCYQGGGQKGKGVLQRSSNLSVKVYLYLPVHDICRLGDLENLWGM